MTEGPAQRALPPPANLVLEVQVGGLSDGAEERSFIVASVQCRSMARLILIAGLSRTLRPNGVFVPDDALSLLLGDEELTRVLGRPGVIQDAPVSNAGGIVTWLMRDAHGGYDLVYQVGHAAGELVLKPLFSLRPDYPPRSLAAGRLLFPGDLDRAIELLESHEVT